MDENGQQAVERIRAEDEVKVDCLRAERRQSTANYWKAICMLSTIIGILTGYLVSDLQFMAQITEHSVKIENIQRQVDENAKLAVVRFEELKKQADDNFKENHALILKIYERK